MTRVVDDHRYWTILVYMGADNDLEPYAIQDMNELERVGSTSAVSVVAEVDRTPGYDGSNGDWTTTRRYYVTKDSDTSTIHSQLIADLGELDTATSQNLADFVNWGIQTYPADHYLLVLWDHGRGWQGPSTMSLFRRQVKAINADYTSGSEMSLEALRNALIQTPKMDIVLFDACLMSMVEVADSIKDCADVMVASEENIPAEGQQYTSVLSRLNTNPTVTPSQFGRILVDAYMDAYGSGYGGTLTSSAVSLASMNQVITAADQLAQAILGNIGSVRTSVRASQQVTQHYDFDPPVRYADYKDLYDFASRVNASVSNAAVRSAAQSVMAAVDNACIYQRNSGGLVGNSYGLSIYLPAPGTMLTQYTQLTFAQNTQWDEFLEGY